MRFKLVKRYFCDFCNKGGLSASSMSKHERHCTMNPNRVCRVCGILKDEHEEGFSPKPITELLAMLPEPKYFVDEYGGQTFPDHFYRELETALPKLREATGDCPACMMAAFRLKKIPVPCVSGFSFKDRMQEIWAALNDRNIREDHYH